MLPHIHKFKYVYLFTGIISITVDAIKLSRHITTQMRWDLVGMNQFVLISEKWWVSKKHFETSLMNPKYILSMFLEPPNNARIMPPYTSDVFGCASDISL